MRFRIITPNECKTHNVAWIEATSITGNMLIQPNHVPTTLILKNNSEVIAKLTSGSEENIKVESGLLDVTRISVTLILKQASMEKPA